jgi:acetoin utilization protein AcuC
MTDGSTGAFTPWSRGHDPHHAVDRAIMATRSATFPWHGLDPYSS